MSERLEEYRKHKAAGTVPKKGIPYTKQSRVRPACRFPDAIYATNPKVYIKYFEKLNGLKEIPQ